MRSFTRTLLLLLATAPAWAQDGRKAAPEAQGEVVRIVGGEQLWAGLPEWRQRIIRERYARYLSANAQAQARMRSKGLREYLIRSGRRFDVRFLPPELVEELKRLPEELRGDATKLTALRLRQMRLDRNFSWVPFGERRELFRRLFPEPFDPKEARKARHELERFAARRMAGRVRGILAREERGRGRPLDADRRRERQRELVRKVIREEEQQLVDRLRRQLQRVRKAHRRGQAQLVLFKEGFPLLDRLHMHVTPRQGELIRWAFRPEKCPLIDEGLIGSAPTDREERQVWLRDFRMLARLDLLSEAGLPPEMVLHLAGSGTPEEFVRAIKSIRG